ncbi:MAG: ATP-binding protein [Desulfobacterales bacterium]|nr:ATP-binding protein [Desulfobacterales bacterium]
MATAGVAIVFLSGVSLLLVLIFQVLVPVRKLISKTSSHDGIVKQKDEVRALSMGVHKLIKDSDHIHTELERSRENLLQAEKMAMVGKLAAGMAHTIRNPMTSVKMRLFSLGRSIELSDTQQEDFDVISDEIRHMDTIVQNFLEFSRPPKLVMQSISPSVVVDLAIQLLTHRLKSYDVDVNVHRPAFLPDVQADPEQLKEVFVNIIVNACEAMGSRGSIFISEEVATESSGKVAVVKLRDTGPGLSGEIRDKIFQPFFTTKDEGTGLGLSIAFRIIEEHGGWIDVVSVKGEGATFILKIPIKESGSGNNIGH